MAITNKPHTTQTTYFDTTSFYPGFKLYYFIKYCIFIQGVRQICLRLWSSYISLNEASHILSREKYLKKMVLNKFALLWGEAQKRIAYSYPRVTYSY